MTAPSRLHDTRNHYDVLSVSHDAPPEVIRAAWLALCRAHHPDRKPGNAAAAAQVAAANVAYETLSNPAARAEYDRSLRKSRWMGASGHDAEADMHRAARARRRWLIAGTGVLAAMTATIVFGLAARKASLAESAWMRPSAAQAAPEQATPPATPNDTTLRMSTSLDTPPSARRSPLAAN